MKRNLIILLICLTWLGVYASNKSLRMPDARMQQFLYYYYDAQRAFYDQQYGKAFAELTFCEQLNPNDAATLNALATFYGSASQEQLALQYAKRAWEINPGNYWSQYANLLVHQKKNKEAISAIEKAHKQKPLDEDILEALFSLYLSSHNTSKALRTLDALEQVEGVNSYNAIRRYQVYLEAGKERKAISYIENFAEKNPDDMQVQIMWGDLLLSMGKTDQALQHFQILLNKESDNPFAYRSLAIYYNEQKQYPKADSCYVAIIESNEWTLGQKLQFVNQNQVRLEQSNLTSSLLKSLIEQYPLDETVYKSVADYYMQVKQDTLQALNYLEILTTINEHSNNYWQTLFSTYLQLGDTVYNTQVEDCIRKAYAIFPNDLYWCYYNMLLLVQSDSLTEAILIGERTVNNPNLQNGQYRSAIYALVADLYSLRKEYSKAFDNYELALQYSPEDVDVLNNYAYLLATQGGDLKKAEKMSAKVIQKEGTNPIYIDTYAWILFLQGQHSLAKFYIKKAYAQKDDIQNATEIIEHYNEIMKKE